MAHDAFKMHIVRSDGRTLDLGDGTYWVLAMNKMDDWLDLDYTVNTSANVLTDGSSFLAERVEEKDRTISATYWGKDRKGVRDVIVPFFNPRYTYEAHLTYFGRTRWVEGRQIGFDMPITDARTPPTLTWTLLCMDPFLRSEDHNESSLTDASPMFGFPYVSHVRQELANGERYPVGSLASKMLYDGLNTIYNSGDVETYYRIVCSFDGPVTNPKFTKDDRFVQVLRAFKDGDELEIDFETAPPRVLVNGTNAIQLCSRDSNFTGMQMQVGANVFQYGGSTAAERAYMHVQVLFYKRYLGV